MELYLLGIDRQSIHLAVQSVRLDGLVRCLHCCFLIVLVFSHCVETMGLCFFFIVAVFGERVKQANQTVHLRIKLNTRRSGNIEARKNRH